jgi:1-acyl-sn-glycerol-3-phosphate acyltransferase
LTISTSYVAAAFLLLVVIAPIVALTIAVFRSRLTAVQCCFWAVAYLLCKFLWRARWLNGFPLPEGRGGIIVCNHRSSVDPFFVQSSTGRKIHWMVAREYCEHPAFRWFLSACEVIPVGRGGVDTAAMKAAIRLAAAGELVGMLPEGRINMSEDLLLPARPGAALVAMKADVPLIPCYIEGAPYRRYPWSPLVMPARVQVRFGQPLDPPRATATNGDDNLAAQHTLDALRAIAALAGQPHFQPRLAGRNWKPTAQELEANMAAKEQREAEAKRLAAGLGQSVSSAAQ